MFNLRQSVKYMTTTSQVVTSTMTMTTATITATYAHHRFDNIEY